MYNHKKPNPYPFAHPLKRLECSFAAFAPLVWGNLIVYQRKVCGCACCARRRKSASSFPEARAVSERDLPEGSRQRTTNGNGGIKSTARFDKFCPVHYSHQLAFGLEYVYSASSRVYVSRPGDRALSDASAKASPVLMTPWNSSTVSFLVDSIGHKHTQKGQKEDASSIPICLSNASSVAWFKLFACCMRTNHGLHSPPPECIIDRLGIDSPFPRPGENKQSLEWQIDNYRRAQCLCCPRAHEPLLFVGAPRLRSAPGQRVSGRSRWGRKKERNDIL